MTRNLLVVCAIAICLSISGMFLVYLVFLEHPLKDMIFAVSFSVLSTVLATSLLAVTFDFIIDKFSRQKLRDGIVEYIDQNLNRKLKLHSAKIVSVDERLNERAFERNISESQNCFYFANVYAKYYNA